MRAHYEAITPEPGSSLAFLDRRLDDAIPFEWHHHPEYELTLTLNSRGFRYIGDHVEAYDDGDLVLVGPGIAHSWHSRELIDPAQPHTSLVVWFTHAWLEKLAATAPELERTAAMLAQAPTGLRFGRAAALSIAGSMIAMRSAAPLPRLALLLDVLHKVSRDNEAAPFAACVGTADPRLPPEPRLARVLAHLHARFAEPVSADAMAQLACMSKSGFHRLFRRHTHTTLVDYLMRLRIGRACSLLLDSARPVAVIAAEAGYANLSLFNRQFVRVKGEAPGAFRHRHRAIRGG